jgi:hypothetical protein
VKWDSRSCRAPWRLRRRRGTLSKGSPRPRGSLTESIRLGDPATCRAPSTPSCRPGAPRCPAGATRSTPMRTTSASCRSATRGCSRRTGCSRASNARTSPATCTCTPTEGSAATLTLTPTLAAYGGVRSVATALVHDHRGRPQTGGVRVCSSPQVYADLDVELLRPLRPLLLRARDANSSVLLGQEPLAHAVLLERKPRQVCNAVLASAKGHPFWLAVMRQIAQAAGGADPVSSTGPRMLERALHSWSGTHLSAAEVVVMEPDAFYPTWDPMQRDTFRQRCAGVRARHTTSVQRGHTELRTLLESVCKRLRSEKFNPVVPPGDQVYTNHLWSHTWIPGATKVNMHSTAQMV